MKRPFFLIGALAVLFLFACSIGYAESNKRGFRLLNEALELRSRARSRSDLQKAKEKLAQAVRIFQEVGDHGGGRMAAARLAAMYADEGAYSDAIEHYELALRSARKTNDVKSQAAILTETGRVFREQGRYNEAAESYQRALDILRPGEDTGARAEALAGLGIIHRNWGRYADAMKCYLDALSIARRAGDPRAQAQGLTNLGDLHKDWGRYAEAEDYYKTSLRLARETGDRRGVARLLINLGDIHVYRAEYRKALEKYRETLALYERLGISTRPIRSAIGELYLDLGERDEARPWIEASEDPAARGRLELANQDYRKAADLYEELLESAERNRDVHDLFTAHTGLGAALEMLGRESASAGHYRRALKLTEELRASLSPDQRDRFFEVRINGFSRTAPYEGLARVLVKTGKAAGAWKDSEFTKARVFAETLARRTEIFPADIPDHISDEGRKLESRLAALKLNRQRAFERIREEGGLASLPCPMALIGAVVGALTGALGALIKRSLFGETSPR